MTICRVNHNKNFTTINNTICYDKRLSAKAKGIWLYAFSRPDDWSFYVKDMMKYFSDGRDSIYSGLNELEEFGYLIRIQSKGKQGKFSKIEWQFFETPQEKSSTDTFQPQTGFPDTVLPDTENPPLLKTKELNTKKTKGYSLDCDYQAETPKDSARPKPSIEGDQEKDFKKFPLKKSQQVLYDEIVQLEPEVNKKDLVITIRQHPEEKLKEAISHVKAEIEKGTIFKKPKMGMIKSILKGKISPINDLVKENKKKLEEAKSQHKSSFSSLLIHEKYASCTLTGKEFPFNRPTKELENSIIEWQKTLKRASLL